MRNDQALSSRYRPQPWAITAKFEQFFSNFFPEAIFNSCYSYCVDMTISQFVDYQSGTRNILKGQCHEI